MASDRGVAYFVLLIYFGLVLLLLPPSSYPLMIAGAVVLSLGAFGAAQAWPAEATPAMSLLIVSFVAGAVLVFPNFPAMGGSPRAAALGFLGSQGIVLLWLALRWPVRRPSAERSSLRQSVMFGAAVAAILSAVATVPIVIGFIVDASEVRRLLWVYPAYFAGTITAAICYWLLQAVSHRPVGLYLIGVLGGTCVYGAVSPVVSISREEPFVLTEMLAIAIVAGVLVGPPVAIGIAEEP